MDRRDSRSIGRVARRRPLPSRSRPNIGRPILRLAHDRAGSWRATPRCPMRGGRRSGSGRLRGCRSPPWVTGSASIANFRSPRALQYWARYLGSSTVRRYCRSYWAPNTLRGSRLRRPATNSCATSPSALPTHDTAAITETNTVAKSAKVRKVARCPQRNSPDNVRVVNRY